MKDIKVAIVGAGNISNTRHIPALKLVAGVEIVGAISNRMEKAERTASQHGFSNFATISDDAEGGAEELAKLDWFKEVDAVAIGAPPRRHYALVKAALLSGKHVLIEKPMTMNQQESDELIELAKDKRLILYVMHNFQYAKKMLKLNEIIESKKYGEIQSITEVQYTNHDRRLPEWYNDLPMGLFYDEAAHFMYLLENHAGKLVIDNSYAVYEDDITKQTPRTLTVNATAGIVPVTMLLNFQSPVCEWYYIVNFKKQIFIYDFFKDILISLPTDGEHLAPDVLKNSLRYTWQFWSQFVANGISMVFGRLLYGHDAVMKRFIDAVRTGELDSRLVGENGRTNVNSINEIVEKANKR